MNKKIANFAVIVPSVVGALAVASVLLFNGLRHALIEDNEVLVHSVAQSLLPALLVNDTQQVEAVMKALESYPGVESAELINAQGASIASYERAGQSIDPTSMAFELASAGDDSNQIHVTAPLTFDSLIVANLHIAVNLWPTYLRIIIWLGLLLIVPSVVYVVVKQLRLKLRFEVIGHGGGSTGGVHDSFDVKQAVNAAMSEAQISLEYQPIIRMGDGGLFGMEVVVCWCHPSGQTLHISPSEFLAVAEQSGICVPFDDWLLMTACDQASAWQRQYGPLVLCINISSSQFQNSEFPKRVRAICEETQYPHQLLELEVNEAALSLQSQQTTLNIQSFEAQGLTVTIDDFGLTQSSLDLLGAFSIGKVKLDRKLVRRIGSDEQVLALVQATLTQAVVQDIQMMVDGVDSLNQHDVLQRMGCILGQGAHFCQPLTAHAFEAFLVNRPIDTDARNIAPASAQRQSYKAVRGAAA